jgi:aerobic C4-dicarboxylate transport protein
MALAATDSTKAGSRLGGVVRSTYFQVLVAIALGALLGFFSPATGEAMKPFGDGFIKLVRMVIAPLIFLTVVTGVTGVRELRSLGRVAGKALIYFFTFSTLALILGLIVANVVRPGAGMHIDPATLDPAAVASYVKQAHETTAVDFILAIIPDTLVSALTTGSLLQVLLVAILFGVSLSLVGPVGEPVIDLLDRLLAVVFRLVAIVMRAAPVGAFGAIAFTIGKYGLGSLISLGALIGTFYLTSALFVILVLGAVGLANGFSIFRLIAYLRTELVLVLGTSSSEAAMPGLIEKMEAAGCARPVVGLVVPTGYSFNLDGTNIYMTLAALFIAQALNVHLPLGAQITLLLVAMLSSKGAAGVTGAGFITLAATLAVVPSVPVAGMVLILGIDRFMSECRSLTNFIGNAVATIVVARWDGALDRDKLAEALGTRPRPAPPVLVLHEAAE